MILWLCKLFSELEKLKSKEQSLEEREVEILQSKLQNQAVTEAQIAGFTWKPLPM